MKRLRESLEVSSPSSLGIDTQSDISCDIVQQPSPKIPELDPACENGGGDGMVDIGCSLPPHKIPVSFTSYGDFEAHYHLFHTHRCLECHKNFPSDHILAIHIEEFHDPLLSIQRDRGERTYSCFVEGCGRKWQSERKRRMHMIDKHMYPKNYFFAVTKEGIDGRKSLVSGARRQYMPSTGSRPVRSSEGPQAGSACEPPKEAVEQLQPNVQQQNAPDFGIESLEKAMSALQFVPASIRFGRGRAGFVKG